VVYLTLSRRLRSVVAKKAGEERSMVAYVSKGSVQRAKFSGEEGGRLKHSPRGLDASRMRVLGVCLKPRLFKENTPRGGGSTCGLWG